MGTCREEYYIAWDDHCRVNRGGGGGSQLAGCIILMITGIIYIPSKNNYVNTWHMTMIVRIVW